MKLGSKELVRITHTEFRNGEQLRGKIISGVSTDSRTTKTGDLFFALRGEKFDGHTFLGDAFAKGAVAAVVETSADFTPVADSPVMLVHDTTRALGELAHVYRMGFKIPVVAVGGSNGKTTTKDMIAHILRSKYSVLSTEGNLNNQIGVPQTLFRLEKKHRIAVVEIGTNHSGEIEYLCSVLQPTHGLITNIGREHLEFFKSTDGVAEEEGKLFDALKARKAAVAFVNADDEHLRARSKGLKKRIMYGLKARQTDVNGRVVGMNVWGAPRVRIKGKRQARALDVQLAVPGAQNAINAIAATAVGMFFKVPSGKIASALESFQPGDKRMQVMHIGGVTILNDTYNANPDSTIAALHTLACVQVSGKRIAVLADMRELGEHAQEEHAGVGKAASGLPLDYLLTFGEMAKHIHKAARLPFTVHYDQKNMLAEYLAELVGPGDAVLVKGSRGVKMEDIVTFLEGRLRATEVLAGQSG